MDHETRAAAADHQALRLWLRLLTCSRLIESRVRHGLREHFQCTLPRFDLMAQLYREADGLPMGVLSRRMMVTGGNVTGIAGQLEHEGLLTRHIVREDRRSIRIRLTPRGRREFAKMARQHELWIVGLMTGMTANESTHLHGLLGVLKTHLNKI